MVLLSFSYRCAIVVLSSERWVKERAGRVRKDFCCGVWGIGGKGVHLQAKRFNENENENGKAP